MSSIKLRHKIVLSCCSLLLAVPCLSGCSPEVSSWFDDVGSWFEDAGKNIVSFFSNDVPQWWSSVTEGATKIFNDIGEGFKEGVEVIKTGVGDCYDRVKNGVVTFYTDFKDSLNIKEANRSTLDAKYYDNDNEALLYSLIDNQLCATYDVFPAYIYHPSTGEVIDGIGFTDRSDHFVDSSGDTYYGAGFLAGINEKGVSKAEILSGIEIMRPEDESESRYLFTCTVDPFHSHFVANDKYVRFGLDENSALYINEREPGQYENEENYGGLYDYDHQTWIFGSENDFISVDGNLLNDVPLDVTTLIKETFNTDGEQYGFSMTLDQILNSASNSLAVVKAKLRKLGNVSFLNSDAQEVVNSISEIKASDIINADGNACTFQNIPSEIGPFETNKVARVLAIVSTIISLLVVCAAVILSFVIPALRPILLPIASALVGASLDLAIQILWEKRDVNDVNWVRLIFASITAVFFCHLGFFGSALMRCLGESVLAFVLRGKTIGESTLIFGETLAVMMIFGVTLGTCSTFGNRIMKRIPTMVKKIEAQEVKKKEEAIAKASEQVAKEMDDDYAYSVTAPEIEAYPNLSQEEQAQRAYARTAARQFPSDYSQSVIKKDSSGNAVYTQNGAAQSLIVANQRIYYHLSEDENDTLHTALAPYGYQSGDLLAEAEDHFLGFAKPIAEIQLQEGHMDMETRTESNAASDRALCAQIQADFESCDPLLKNYLNQHGYAPEGLDENRIAQMRIDLGLLWHEAGPIAMQLVPLSLHRAGGSSGGLRFDKIMVALGNAQALVETAA